MGSWFETKADAVHAGHHGQLPGAGVVLARRAGPHPRVQAHRDDVEQTCGGTLIRMAEQGYRTGVLDLDVDESADQLGAADDGRGLQPTVIRPRHPGGS